MTKKNLTNDNSSMNFSGLILGFGSAALSYMGLTTQGSTDPTNKNLELARQNIEILEILIEKTRGNLTHEEQHLIEHVLADLRMKYVEASR